MKIACVGYIFSGNKITVSYDTVNKKYLIHEIFKTEGIKEVATYKVDSKKVALDIIKDLKKSINK